MTVVSHTLIFHCYICWSYFIMKFASHTFIVHCGICWSRFIVISAVHTFIINHGVCRSHINISCDFCWSYIIVTFVGHIYLLDSKSIKFGSKLYRQFMGIPMVTNCAPLVANSFLFYYERDLMLSLSDNNQTDIIEAFHSISRYLDDLLIIDNPYFEQMVNQIYPTELQLNKANYSYAEPRFWTWTCP